MAWDFETDPEFQAKLDWADEFVRREVEPLDLAFPDTAAPAVGRTSLESSPSTSLSDVLLGPAPFSPGLRGMSARVQELIGYSIHPPFMGHVRGRHPRRLVEEAT